MENNKKAPPNTVKAKLAVFVTLIVIAIGFTGTKIVDNNYFEIVDNANTGVDLTATDEDQLMLVPVGSAFGIKLYTDGIVVTEISEVTTDFGTYFPARDAGIEVGDYIISANGETVTSNDHLSSIITSSPTECLELVIRRDGELFETNLYLISDNGFLRAGLWIRDSTAGIGTITYYNPETGEFAGLGHGICDVDTGEIMNLKNGVPAEVTITSVTKSTDGSPGMLNGYFSDESSMGEITINSETGVYGTLYEVPEGEAIPVAETDEVELGYAQILTTIDENGPQYYDVEITRISTSENTKNLVIKITDEELLEETGGIIQGMSGSSIVQNGKLIGALTHVFVNDATKGYGILIENMLKTVDEG